VSVETPDILLSLRGLSTQFLSDDGVVEAVDGVSFDVPRGRTVGLVGESGCGKSMTALSILGLVPLPGRIVAGEVLFEGRDLVRMSPGGLRRVRGREVAMVFQEPMSSLNPVFTIGDQIVEVLRRGGELSRKAARAEVVDLLRRVRIPDPHERVDSYPHELSGGMRQRAMIAMAIAARPKLLIADEPTTALDVTVQAQVLDLLRELQAELGMSVLLISHDLGVVAQLADEVVVMYAAKVVERAAVEELYARPLHPYTRGLFGSRPRLGAPRGERLNAIPGAVPRPGSLPPGCRFHPRCSLAIERCCRVEPALRPLRPRHLVACDVVE
jgi:oligopeptide/dipeptide ABC transporter ATP-binding protein